MNHAETTANTQPIGIRGQSLEIQGNVVPITFRNDIVRISTPHDCANKASNCTAGSGFPELGRNRIGVECAGPFLEYHLPDDSASNQLAIQFDIDMRIGYLERHVRSRRSYRERIHRDNTTRNMVRNHPGSFDGDSIKIHRRSSSRNHCGIRIIILRLYVRPVEAEIVDTCILKNSNLFRIRPIFFNTSEKRPVSLADIAKTCNGFPFPINLGSIFSKGI